MYTEYRMYSQDIELLAPCSQLNTQRPSPSPSRPPLLHAQRPSRPSQLKSFQQGKKIVNLRSPLQNPDRHPYPWSPTPTLNTPTHPSRHSRHLRVPESPGSVPAKGTETQQSAFTQTGKSQQRPSHRSRTADSRRAVRRWRMQRLRSLACSPARSDLIYVSVYLSICLYAVRAALTPCLVARSREQARSSFSAERSIGQGGEHVHPGTTIMFSLHQSPRGRVPKLANQSVCLTASSPVTTVLCDASSLSVLV